MEFIVIREESTGDLILEVEGAPRRLRARREVPNQPMTPILLDGTLLQGGRLAGQLQVHCIKYRWPDGYQKWGPYLGSVHALENE